MQRTSPFADSEAVSSFVIDVIRDACSDRWSMPGVPLGGALYAFIKTMLYEEPFLMELPDGRHIETLTLEEGVHLRQRLRQYDQLIAAQDRLLPRWREIVVRAIQIYLTHLPESAFIDVNEDGGVDDDSVVFPSAHAFALASELPLLLDRLMVAFYEDDILVSHLFDGMRRKIEIRLSHASGFDYKDRFGNERRTIAPSSSKISNPEALVDMYTSGSPVQRLLYAELPFAIPFPARFEHTHIVGGTGHGKTQLMQFLIHHDIVRSREDGRSIVVIDSQGDLINTVSRLGHFADPDFAERVVLVNPNDVEHPACLNMFDFNRDRLSGYAPLDREKILNATIELYEYFFGALLGAELTQRQGLIFRYLARLLIEIPDATIHTLRELMEDGDKFRPHMEKLTGAARSFYVTQFFDPKFKETKKQILTRLWGVLSNSSLERMFSHTRNRIDIFELLNQGKIIFINTAKDLLGQEGAAIFGRFFIALISQAAIQRTALQPHERRPAFVYIDEAQDYFDDNISHLLNQARKYRVGLVFAHQNLDQLSAGLRSSVLASTTIKLAGGVSAKDAGILDSEYRCTTDFLLSQKKDRSRTEFACFIKNYTSRALTISIPLGFVEGMPQISTDRYNALIERSRELYTEPPLVPEDMPFPDRFSPQERKPKVSAREKVERDDVPASPVKAPERRATDTLVTELSAAPLKRKPAAAVPRQEDVQPGRGGRQHKYLQQLIKQLGEERGFRASIEETILDGAGRVDVSLVREKMRVACQVSVTTTKDWELGGIEKCLAAGYTNVVLVGGTEKHVKALSKFIEENLDPKDQGKVKYVASEGIIEFLDSLGQPTTTEQVVRGYKVKTVQRVTDADDAAARRKAVSEVIARSLQRSEK